MAHRRARTNLGRRLVGPVIILLVAAVIAILVWDRQKTQTAEVQEFVETMCRRVALGDNVAWSMAGANRAVTRSLTADLRSLLAGRDLGAGEWSVEIVAGDVSAMADGTATHTATIVVHDEPVLGIRLAYEDAPDDPDLSAGTQIEVLGYWLE